MSVEFSLAMEPKQAIAHFSKKKVVETERWDDLKKEAHAKAFTVARSAGYDIVGDIYASLLEAQKSGEPKEVWMSKLEPLLAKKGWIGTKEDADGNVIELGTPRRLDTIYQTNIQSAYMAGQWKGMWENRKNRPYLMYNAKHDGKTRPSHIVLDGRVYHAADPFWDTHLPPNGYRCRCGVIALNDKDLQKLGKSVETPPPLETIRTINSKTGEVYETKAYTYIDAKGEPVLSKPDVGFDYNIGKFSLAQLQTIAYEKAARLQDRNIYAKALEEINLSTLEKPFVDFIKKGFPLVDEIKKIHKLQDKEAKKALLGKLHQELNSMAPITAGIIDMDVRDFLVNRGVTPPTPIILLESQILYHMLRDTKSSRGAALGEQELLLIFQKIRNKECEIIFDSKDRNILYVFELNGHNKIAIEVDYFSSGYNKIVTTGKVVPGNLIDPRYERIR